jgi:hypothetical protein
MLFTVPKNTFQNWLANDPEGDIWSSIISIFSNAFGEAFKKMKTEPASSYVSFSRVAKISARTK